jgi:hypothetical protein
MATAASQVALESLSFQFSLLRSDLERCARFRDEGAAIIAELAVRMSAKGWKADISMGLVAGGSHIMSELFLLRRPIRQ